MTKPCSPSSLSRIRRWGAAIPLACSLAAPCHAALTGDFSPSNWVLVNTNLDEALPLPSYTCAPAPGSLGYEVACVDLLDPSNGTFDLYGSAAGFNGGDNAPGAITTDRTSTFYVVNLGAPAFVGFDWFFTAIDATNTDVASYLTSDGATITQTLLGTSTSTTPATISGLLIPTNGSIAFRVATDNQGNPGLLSITNFNASPVPGPMSLIGAAAVFRFSRKIRTRIQRSSIT